MQWQYEEFHSMEHHPLRGDAERYPDFDDIPDDWIPKRKPFLTEELNLQANTQYGSNVGGVHTDTETGKKYYIKFPHAEQAHVEAAMGELYEKWGIPTVKPTVISHNGKVAVSSEWNDSLEKIRPTDYPELMKTKHHAESIAKMHHAAIITGNRDILGLVGDNIMRNKDTDQLVSLDQGGSMHFRAQGGDKPYEKNIDEVESFRNPKYMTNTVFGAVDNHHPDAFKRAIEPFKTVPDTEIRSVLNKHGLERFSDIMIARKNLLVSRYG